EAVAWATRAEADILEAKDLAPGRPVGATFGDLLSKYAETVSIKKRSGDKEAFRIAAICRDSIASVALKELSSRHFAEWRDRRLTQVSPASVDREWNLLSHACR